MNFNFQSAQHFADELLRQQQNIVLEQLNGLVERGLLVVTQGPVTLAQDPASLKIQVRQTISLEPKEQERINELEEENRRLKERLSCVEEAFYKEGNKYG